MFMGHVVRPVLAVPQWLYPRWRLVVVKSVKDRGVQSRVRCTDIRRMKTTRSLDASKHADPASLLASPLCRALVQRRISPLTCGFEPTHLFAHIYEGTTGVSLPADEPSDVFCVFAGQGRTAPHVGLSPFRWTTTPGPTDLASLQTRSGALWRSSQGVAAPAPTACDREVAAVLRSSDACRLGKHQTGDAR